MYLLQLRKMLKVKDIYFMKSSFSRICTKARHFSVPFLDAKTHFEVTPGRLLIWEDKQAS